MNVAELRAWLLQQNPNSPVRVMGISPTGESVSEQNIRLGIGQGPTDDLDEVIISWEHTPEAETFYELGHLAYQQADLIRNGDVTREQAMAAIARNFPVLSRRQVAEALVRGLSESR
jgi:hypothetical protein